MLLIKGAEVYAPEYLGKKDVLIAGEKIERIGEDLPEYEGCQVIDGTGRIVAPGFIDRHVHITGGGGEGSFHTQAPQVQLSDLIRGGVTTVVGLLGTDGISRSTENLVAKAKALNFCLLLLRSIRASGSDHHRKHQQGYHVRRRDHRP